MPGLEDLSDQELELVSQGKLESLSDSALQAIASEAQAPLPSFDTGKSTEDILMSLLQGATFGHLPQVGGAIKAGAVSGPEYESEKQAISKRLAQREPVTGALGEVAGSVVSPVGLGASALLRGGASIPRAAAVGAGLGALQSPGGDLSLEQIQERLKGAALGGALGGGLSAVSGPVSRGMESFAERRAFSALRPFKAAVKEARARDRIEPVGRTLLDEQIIGNIPRSSEALAERIGEAKKLVGEKKSQIIDDIESLVDRLVSEGAILPAKPGQKIQAKAGVEVKSLKAAVKDNLKVNADLPQAEQFEEKLDKFLEGFAKGKERLSVKEADKLKTDLGKFVRRWYRPGAPQVEPFSEQFNKELYRALNKGVDDAAELMAKTYKPDIVEDLRKIKSTYGNLSEAEKIAGQRFEADFANRFVSPSDYGVGMATSAGSLARGERAVQAGLVGAAAAGVNHFLRKYGNQITAKQVDNLSKLIGSKALQNIMLVNPTVGAERATKRLKALEKEDEK